MSYQFPVFVFLSLALVSCNPKEDPEVLKKLEETNAQVLKAEEELDVVETEIKRIKIADPSEDLTKLKLQSEELEAQKVALEAELAEIEKAQEKAEQEFAAYKKKYLLR